jgi:hypothetical protein
VRRRWPAAAVCSLQAALALALALRACSSCGRPDRWAWAGAACYAALAGLVLVPRAAPLAGLMVQGALAIHACLVASMLRAGLCAACLGAAGLAVALWLVWRPLDGRAAWRSALDFIPILALAAAVVRPADPARVEAAADAPPDGVVELVVFEDPSCPHCRELAERLPSIRAEHPGLVVRRLPAADFPFVRAVPTMLVRGPGGRRLFEGLPDAAALSAAIRAAER